ncbi:hypothetical protein D3C71_1002020 [compost metagenome]
MGTNPAKALNLLIIRGASCPFIHVGVSEGAASKNYVVVKKYSCYSHTDLLNAFNKSV